MVTFSIAVGDSVNQKVCILCKIHQSFKLFYKYWNSYVMVCTATLVMNTLLKK